MGVTERMAAQQPGKRFRPWKTLATIWGAGLAAGCVESIPAVLDPSHRIDDVLNGVVIQAAGGACVLLTIMILGAVGMRRLVDRGRSPWPAYGATMGVLLAMGTAAIMLPAVHRHRLAADLAARGVLAQAKVVRQFSEGCGKTGCRTGLEYSFVTKGRRTPIRGVADEGTTSRDPAQEYQYATLTGTLPIRYDPADLGRSMVDWNNGIGRQAAAGLLSVDVAVWSTLLLLGLAIIGAIMFSLASSLSDSLVEP